MLLCRMALGKVGTGWSSLPRPSRGFHSACDNSTVAKPADCLSSHGGASYGAHTIFHREQAYPAYLVLFDGAV